MEHQHKWIVTAVELYEEDNGYAYNGYTNPRETHTRALRVCQECGEFEVGAVVGAWKLEQFQMPVGTSDEMMRKPIWVEDWGKVPWVLNKLEDNKKKSEEENHDSQTDD